MESARDELMEASCSRRPSLFRLSWSSLSSCWKIGSFTSSAFAVLIQIHTASAILEGGGREGGRGREGRGREGGGRGEGGGGE